MVGAVKMEYPRWPHPTPIRLGANAGVFADGPTISWRRPENDRPLYGFSRRRDTPLHSRQGVLINGISVLGRPPFFSIRWSGVWPGSPRFPQNGRFGHRRCPALGATCRESDFAVTFAFRRMGGVRHFWADIGRSTRSYPQRPPLCVAKPPPRRPERYIYPWCRPRFLD